MALKSRLKMLQDRDAAITAEMRKMSDLLGAETRSNFNEEEEAKYQLLKSEAVEVQKGLAVENDILAQEKRLKTVTDNNVQDLTDHGGMEVPPIDKWPASVARSYNLQSFKGEGKTRREWNEDAYSAGMFLAASLWKNRKAARWCSDHGMVLREYNNGPGEMLAQSEISNTAGAILVPDVLSDRIIDLKEEYGVFAKYAGRWPMTSDNLTIPRRLSGVTAYFVSDGVATTESQAGWDGVTLSAKELAALIRYPLTLSEDAIISMADKLAFEIAYAFANKEDLAGFTGDGSATYGGIQGLTTLMNDANHGNSVTTNGTINGGQVVAAAAGTSFGATVLKDYENMVGLLPQFAAANAKWYFSRAGFAAGPQRLMDAAGGNTNTNLATGGNGSLKAGDGGMPLAQFLGYPVVISQALNSTLGAQASVVVAFFGDLSLASSYGSRREVGISTSTDRYFEFRHVGIQGVERFDIVNHDLGTTSTAGPIVSLKTSAS